jgi:hypothetical protein
LSVLYSSKFYPEQTHNFLYPYRFLKGILTVN